ALSSRPHALIALPPHYSSRRASSLCASSLVPAAAAAAAAFHHGLPPPAPCWFPHGKPVPTAIVAASIKIIVSCGPSE
ncbi:Os02g0549401, partial [Oryza sativa Japonica Group]